MDLGLKEKVVLITGASKGIGLRTAQAFAGEGSRLGICARTKEDVEVAKAGLQSRGCRVEAVQADVREPGDAARFIERCVAELGAIDILVNNVGKSFGGDLMESDDEEWESTFAVNLFQTVRMIRLAVPHMRKRGGGSIVNVASLSGWEVQMAGNGQYGSSKAAIIFLGERFALELARDKIRVNTVSPGAITFPGGYWEEVGTKHPESLAAYIRDGLPMGRLGKPEEVADAIVFLASPRANWINGRNIAVDGLQQPVPLDYQRPY